MNMYRGKTVKNGKRKAKMKAKTMHSKRTLQINSPLVLALGEDFKNITVT